MVPSFKENLYRRGRGPGPRGSGISQPRHTVAATGGDGVRPGATVVKNFQLQ